MNKWLKSVIVVVCALVLVTFFGCAMFQDALTPCYIEPDAIVYTGEEPTSLMPWTSLWDADRIDRAMDYIYKANLLKYARSIEDENVRYAFIKGTQAIHTQGAREFQQTIFSTDGPIGLAIVGLGFGTLGALGIKRPGDSSRKQVERENGATA